MIERQKLHSSIEHLPYYLVTAKCLLFCADCADEGYTLLFVANTRELSALTKTGMVSCDAPTTLPHGVLFGNVAG